MLGHSERGTAILCERPGRPGGPPLALPEVLSYGRPTAKVFISYRRGDSAGYAGRLYDGLSKRFGDANVFMDVLLPAGEDFVARIEEAVGSCDVLLALIGREWLTVSHPDGRRRLEDPGDFPRIEIEAALKADVHVVPVLVAEAKMPAPDQLPEGLAALARRQAHELSDSRWDYDLDRLIGQVARLAGEEPAREPKDPRRRRSTALAAGVAALATAGGVALAAGAFSGGSDPAPDSGPSAFATEAGKICADRNRLQEARKQRFSSYRKRLEGAKTAAGQRDAIYDETQARLNASAHLNGRVDALEPPAALRRARVRTLTAWRRNVARLRRHRDRLEQVGTYDQLTAVLRKYGRSAVEADADRIDAGLERMGGTACDLDPVWNDPKIALHRPGGGGLGGGVSDPTPSQSYSAKPKPRTEQPNPTPNPAPAPPSPTVPNPTPPPDQGGGY